MASSNTRNASSDVQVRVKRSSSEIAISTNTRPNSTRVTNEDKLGSLGISVDRGIQRGPEYSFKSKQDVPLDNKFLNESTQILSENLGDNEYSVPLDKFQNIEGENFYQSDENDFSYSQQKFGFEKEVVEMSKNLFQNNKIKNLKQVKVR